MKRRQPFIDCLAFEALDSEAHMRRVSNHEFLDYLRRTVWDGLTADKRELFEKLLASDRSRFVACDDLDELAADTHETRYRRYKDRLESLSLKCIDSLMTRADVPRQAIALVLTNHTVGGVCPPLSSLVAHHLGLSPTVQAIDLAYMGCSAGIWGMELAARLLTPGQVGIILSTELTSVMTNVSGVAESLVASCVFGDGIGAFLVASPPHPFKARFRAVDFSGSLISTQGGLDCIRYEPNPVYHEIRLKETIPAVAKQGIRQALEPLVRRNLVTLTQRIAYLFNRRAPHWQHHVDYFVLHTAGNKILKDIQETLGLTNAQTGHNFECFRKYGNTSSASIYYSLRELEATTPLKSGDRLVFLAYGSGFMTKGMYAAVP
jgi:alkylresorcinol/alkylpyrone synthase